MLAAQSLLLSIVSFDTQFESNQFHNPRKVLGTRKSVSGPNRNVVCREAAGVALTSQRLFE